MRYRCLVLDHDDTVTDSTAYLHYPAFLHYLKVIGSDLKMTLDEYFMMNFDPGFVEYCRERLHLTDEDLKEEEKIWLSFVRDRIPPVYPGMKHLIERFTAAGGHICVVSHSMAHNILRDYAANGLPEPELVFGWEQSEDKRKPHVWPLEQIMSRLGLRREELLMVDDLKPGFDMAARAGVDFAAAMWAYEIPMIRGFMQQHCEHCFETPEALEAFVFNE